MSGVPRTFTSGWIQVGYVILNRDGHQWVTNLFRNRDDAKAMIKTRHAWSYGLVVAKAYRITIWKPKHMRWLDRVAALLKLQKLTDCNEEQVDAPPR